MSMKSDDLLKTAKPAKLLRDMNEVELDAAERMFEDALLEQQKQIGRLREMQIMIGGDTAGIDALGELLKRL